MNSSDRRKNVLPKWLVLLVLLAVTAVASAQKEKEKKSAPAPHASAPKAASAPHQAPAPHTAGATNRGSGGGATHGPTAGGTATHGPTAYGAGSHGPTANSGGGHAATTGHTTTSGHTATAGHTTTPGRTNTNAYAGRSNVGSHTPPGRSVTLRGGGSASLRPNGQIRSINRNSIQIQHGIYGGRTVVGFHNGARVVNTGAHGGYVQHAYVTRGGHSYYSRTYYDHGVYRTGVYRGYYYGGYHYYGYHPGFWYHPGFYAWGYQPWGAPVYWGVGAWGWGGAPWFGFYGGWFTPYPYYASPAFWLTDYLIAEELQAAYEARAEANAEAAADAQASGGGDAAPAAAAGPVTLSPEVKQAIADEVKAQLAAQQAEAAQSGASGGQAAVAPAPASGEVPPALDPARRTFVVASDLTVVVVGSGQECALTAGDVLTRLTDTPDADQTVNASVSASKKSECTAGQTVAVKVDDLQEMQNHFAEQLNSGLGELAKKQGTGGIPKAPDTTTTESDIPAPPPDTSAAKTLQDQQAAADQTESQVKQETAGGGAQ